MGYERYSSGQSGIPSLGGSVGVSVSPPQTSTQRVIQNALDGQENSINNLHGVVSLLYDRLSLVLAPEPSQPGVNEAQVNKAPVSIINRVDSNTQSIEAAVTRLSHLIDRLQL